MSERALLGAHKTDWEELASLDAMWAILSERDKRGNKWDSEQFFRSGQEEVAQLMAEFGPLSTGRHRALDFGCGVGRLTRALLSHYDEAHGVDISDGMIEKARSLTPRCQFYVNNSDDLSLFSDAMFDLVYSNRVLQHMPSSVMIGRYLGEFFRITAPGGLVVFQVPSRKSLRNLWNVKRSAYHLLKGLGVRSEVIFAKFDLHPMRMTAYSTGRVAEKVRKSGGELLRQRSDTSAHFAVLYACRKLDCGSALNESV